MESFIPRPRLVGVDRSTPAHDRYKILGRIASGGMAEIYLARMARAGGWQEVALKRLSPDLQANHEFVQMFYDEARIASQMSHPNIVQIYELGELDGSLFIAMELIRGVNLKELQERALNDGKEVATSLALRIGCGALEALSYAHSFVDDNGVRQNVVHRDVSPQNILVTWEGEVKLVDFGVAKAEGRLHETREGLVKGKFAYMAPEQITGEPVDERSDLFALAEVMYQLILNRHPFYAENDAAVLKAVVDARAVAPTALDPKFPQGLSRILLRSMRRDPADRFQNAKGMHDAIEKYALDRVGPVSSDVLGTFVRELFGDRLELEARARIEANDDLLVDAMRVGSRHERPHKAPPPAPKEVERASPPAPRRSSARPPPDKARAKAAAGHRGRKRSDPKLEARTRSKPEAPLRGAEKLDVDVTDRDVRHLLVEVAGALERMTSSPEASEAEARTVAIQLPSAQRIYSGSQGAGKRVEQSEERPTYEEPVIDRSGRLPPEDREEPTIEIAFHEQKKAPPAPRSRSKAAKSRSKNISDKDRTAMPSPDVVGTKVGKYMLLKRLGRGSTAEVFLARQSGPQGFEKRVTLKRILPEFSGEEAFVELFLKEAKLAAMVSHPNVVQILDLGVEDGQYHIAMEYVHGWDLARILDRCRSSRVLPPVTIACRIMSDVCSALAAAHTSHTERGRLRPILHGDVAPQNVLISTEGVVKLTDFGIAKAANPASDDLRGKPQYMAPERLSHEERMEVDARSDIFSAGVLLYETLTLQPMFKRATAFETMMAVLRDPFTPIAALRKDVPKTLETIVERASARSPADRFQSAHAFQLELERFLTRLEEPVTAAHLAAWLRPLFSRDDDAEDILTDAGMTVSADLDAVDNGRRPLVPSRGPGSKPKPRADRS